MGEKSHYNYRVEPQDVDFTLRATIPSLGSAILNTAGIDAHGKGFGVDALNADNHSWVLSRMAVEFDCQPGQYTDYTIATWINEYGRVLSTRNFTLTDAAGNEFGRAVTQWAMPMPTPSSMPLRRPTSRERSAMSTRRRRPCTKSFTATSTLTAMSIRCAI